MHACLSHTNHCQEYGLCCSTPMPPHAPLISAYCIIALIRTHCIRAMFVPSASPRRNLNRNNTYCVPSPCMHAFHTQLAGSNQLCVVQHPCLPMPSAYCLIAIILTHCIRAMCVQHASSIRNLTRNNACCVPSKCMHAIHTQSIARNKVCSTPMPPHAPLISAYCLIALIRTHCIRAMFVPSASPRRNLNTNNTYCVPSP